MAEAGFPGLDLEMWHGMVAPAGLPAPIVQRLNAEFIKAARDPDILRIVEPQATDVFVGSPEEFGKRIASDTERLSKVIREAGIKAQ
jgi:tripartite-type tricarboxylate transporter receptor subunit TctC